MAKHHRPAYSVAAKQTVAKVQGLQAVRFAMAPGESTPWHYHTEITDHFFCLSGPLEVHLRDPDETVTLACGDELTIPPQRIHRAINPADTPARYLLLQGIGEYDFIVAAVEEK